MQSVYMNYVQIKVCERIGIIPIYILIRASVHSHVSNFIEMQIQFVSVFGQSYIKMRYVDGYKVRCVDMAVQSFPIGSIMNIASWE